jgi:16S rRNA processing protein RimM
MNTDKPLVSVGRIAGAFGIKGWVKVSSFTEPAENLFAYVPWLLRDRTGRDVLRAAELLECKVHGKAWVARLAGVDDRDSAEALKGLEIAVERDQLPPTGDGQYYWTDLEGLRVEDRDGQVLGRIDHLLETGATDVMVIVQAETGKRLVVPFAVGNTVLEVDLRAGFMRIDWDEDE